MLTHERIREAPCGCHYDSPTGLVTHYCEEHDPEPRVLHATNLTGTTWHEEEGNA